MRKDDDEQDDELTVDKKSEETKIKVSTSTIKKIKSNKLYKTHKANRISFLSLCVFL